MAIELSTSAIISLGSAVFTVVSGIVVVTWRVSSMEKDMRDTINQQGITLTAGMTEIAKEIRAAVAGLHTEIEVVKRDVSGVQSATATNQSEINRLRSKNESINTRIARIEQAANIPIVAERTTQ